MKYNYIPLACEIVTFTVGFLFLRKIKETIFRLLVLLVGISASCELLVYKLNSEPWFDRCFLYNVFSFWDIAVWLFIFYTIIITKWFKILLIISGVVLNLYGYFELSVFKSWNNFHTDSFRMYELIILISSIWYLYEQLEVLYYRTFAEPLFYVCTGCIFYHSILFIETTTQSELVYWKMKGTREVFYLLLNIANLIYYSSLIISFCVWYYSNRPRAKQYYQDLS